MPYFGCREFPANFALFDEDEIDTAYPGEVKDLGYMLYDFDYSIRTIYSPCFSGLNWKTEFWM